VAAKKTRTSSNNPNSSSRRSSLSCSFQLGAGYYVACPEENRVSSRHRLRQDQPSMNPRFTAIVTAWVRSFAFSLERMLRMCPLTVSSESLR